MNNNNLYNGIFYCVNCGKPKHIFYIMSNELCKCGSFRYITNIDCDIEQMIKEWDNNEICINW